MHKENQTYPFGILTIPWYLCGCVLALWAFAPLYIHHFGFAALEFDLAPKNMHYDDFAGYVGFFFVGSVMLLSGIALTVIHWNTFRLPLPKLRTFLVPFIVSTLIFTAPYIMVSVFYEENRSLIRGTNTWASIAGICSVGFAHFIVLTAMAKLSPTKSNITENA
jgi:hypothetical protein